MARATRAASMRPLAAPMASRDALIERPSCRAAESSSLSCSCAAWWGAAGLQRLQGCKDRRAVRPQGRKGYRAAKAAGLRPACSAPCSSAPRSNSRVHWAKASSRERSADTLKPATPPPPAALPPPAVRCMRRASASPPPRASSLSRACRTTSTMSPSLPPSPPVPVPPSAPVPPPSGTARANCRSCALASSSCAPNSAFSRRSAASDRPLPRPPPRPSLRGVT
eukprot:scaffold70794_cov63-Phaeocystis_antarctica.AAC.1